MKWETKGNLRRLALVRTPWFRVFIHHIPHGDHDRVMHNHPWRWAWSLIIAGGYTEVRRDPSYVHQKWVSYNRWSVVRWTLHTYHRILAVDPGTYTLFIAGPRTGLGWKFEGQ